MATDKEDDVSTLKVESRERTWGVPVMVVCDVLGYRFRRDGKGVQGTEKTHSRGLGSWWGDVYVHRAKSVPLKTKCHRVGSQRCQHRFEWKYFLALERSQDGESTP